MLPKRSKPSDDSTRGAQPEYASLDPAKMFGPIDEKSLDPRKFMHTPLDLLTPLRDNYEAYEAPRDGRSSIKVRSFPNMVTTALETMKEHSDKGNGHRASEGAALGCCVAFGIEALAAHPVARDNTEFTRGINLLKDCDLRAHEIVAAQYRDFAETLAVPGACKTRTVWLATHLANQIHGLAQNMGAKPGEVLLAAVMSSLSTQDFLSDERRLALARTVGEYMKGYSYRARFGLAAINVAEEIEAEADPWV